MTQKHTPDLPDRIFATTGLYYDYVSDWTEGEWGLDDGDFEYMLATPVREAAPELLEALVYARRFLKPNDVYTAFIDAAIAKATGETQ